MSALLRSSSRLFSRSNRRFSQTVASKPPRETILSSSILSDQFPPSNGPPPPMPEPEVVKSSWSFLKYGIIAAFTGAAATAGYATYAYSLDEIDEKTKALRASANITIGDNAYSSDKFKAYLQAAAMTVSAEVVEAYLDLRRFTEEHVRGFTEPISDKLLPDLHPLEQHVFTLVLDLKETLIYSDWKRERGWRTFKRPGVDAFLEHLAQFYEIVVYSDEQNMYVDPVAERLDPKHCIRYRLSRGATRYIDGKHYRDLSMLNRDPAKVLYISGHALETSLQPENSVPIKAWLGEAEDTALVDLIPFLECKHSTCTAVTICWLFVAVCAPEFFLLLYPFFECRCCQAPHPPADIRAVLDSYQGRDIPKEFVERSKEHQRRMEEQKQHSRPWRQIKTPIVCT